MPRDNDGRGALVELKNGTDVAAKPPRARPHSDNRRAERRGSDCAPQPLGVLLDEAEHALALRAVSLRAENP